MMNPFRCAICGETTLMSDVPERCPFCGSISKYVLSAAEWIDYGRINMSNRSYKDCRKALKLELNNYAYYKCAAENAENQITQAIFRRLMKQEFEHAEVFADAIGMHISEEKLQDCFNNDFQNMINSNAHETEAITFYTKVANRATEPRIRQIFRAIAEVENQHLILTNMYLFREIDYGNDIMENDQIDDLIDEILD